MKMSSKMAKFFARRLEKAGYRVNNRRGDYQKGWNNVEFILSFVYVAFSVASALSGVCEAFRLDSSDAWNTISVPDILSIVLKPIIFINLLVMGKLYVKIMMLRNKKKDYGLSKLLKDERGHKDVFCDPVHKRLNRVIVGFIVILIMSVMLFAICFYAKKKMYGYLFSFLTTLISSLLVFIDELTENLIRRYEAEEQIYKKQIII